MTRSIRCYSLCLVFTTVTLLFFAGVAAGVQPCRTVPQRSRVDLKAAYAFSFNTVSKPEFFSVLPSYSYILNRFGSEDLGLDVEVVLEGLFDYYTEPETGYGYGAIPMLRLNLINRVLVPYISAGSGPYYLDLTVHELGQKFNFKSQAEFGLRAPFGNGWSAEAAYRAQHVSNLGMSDRNDGINSHQVVFGFAYRF